MTDLLAIIPARSGSKRIPGKNIRDFAGKPIIAYSIETALACDLFADVVVSTDCDEIAGIAETYGATTPYRRPADLSNDTVMWHDVISHALVELDAVEKYPYVCCLTATAPLMQPQSILRGYQAIQEPGVNTALSVTHFPFPIYRAMKPDGDALSMVWPEYELTPSNDLPETFHDAAHFYWIKPATFLETPRFFTNHSKPVLVDRRFVQDLDTEEDWEFAELLYAAHLSQKRQSS